MTGATADNSRSCYSRLHEDLGRRSPHRVMGYAVNRDGDAYLSPGASASARSLRSECR